MAQHEIRYDKLFRSGALKGVTVSSQWITMASRRHAVVAFNTMRRRPYGKDCVTGALYTALNVEIINREGAAL